MQLIAARVARSVVCVSIPCFGGRRIVMSMSSVCMSVCLSTCISREPQTLPPNYLIEFKSPHHGPNFRLQETPKWSVRLRVGASLVVRVSV